MLRLTLTCTHTHANTHAAGSAEGSWKLSVPMLGDPFPSPVCLKCFITKLGGHTPFLSPGHRGGQDGMGASPQLRGQGAGQSTARLQRPDVGIAAAAAAAEAALLSPRMKTLSGDLPAGQVTPAISCHDWRSMGTPCQGRIPGQAPGRGVGRAQQHRGHAGRHIRPHVEVIAHGGPGRPVPSCQEDPEKDGHLRLELSHGWRQPPAEDQSPAACARASRERSPRLHQRWDDPHAPGAERVTGHRQSRRHPVCSPHTGRYWPPHGEETEQQVRSRREGTGQGESRALPGSPSCCPACQDHRWCWDRKRPAF